MSLWDAAFYEDFYHKFSTRHRLALPATPLPGAFLKSALEDMPSRLL